MSVSAALSQLLRFLTEFSIIFKMLRTRNATPIAFLKAVKVLCSLSDTQPPLSLFIGRQSTGFACRKAFCLKQCNVADNDNESLINCWNEWKNRLKISKEFQIEKKLNNVRRVAVAVCHPQQFGQEVRSRYWANIYPQFIRNLKQLKVAHSRDRSPTK